MIIAKSMIIISASNDQQDSMAALICWAHDSLSSTVLASSSYLTPVAVRSTIRRFLMVVVVLSLSFRDIESVLLTMQLFIVAEFREWPGKLSHLSTSFSMTVKSFRGISPRILVSWETSFKKMFIWIYLLGKKKVMSLKKKKKNSSYLAE